MNRNGTACVSECSIGERINSERNACEDCIEPYGVVSIDGKSCVDKCEVG